MDYQDKNPDYPKMLLQTRYNSYTDEEFAYVEKFLCDNNKMIYSESYAWEYNSRGRNYSFDEVKSYQMLTTFDFKCTVMPWANNQVRMVYLGAVGNNKENFTGTKMKVPFTTHEKLSVQHLPPWEIEELEKDFTLE